MPIILFDIGVVLALASGFALLAKAFQQPLIIAYILAGIVAGLFGFFNHEESRGVLDFLATFGVTFLLFLVGLELRFSELKTYGFVSAMTGIGQIVFTSAIGFLILLLLGFELTGAIYVAVALTFSSTIIVIKLLTEKRDLDSLYGRITVGFLLVQDAVAILALILVSTIGDGSFSWVQIVGVILKAAVMIGTIIVLSQGLLPWIFRKAAHSLEILFILAISWMLLVASISVLLGLSVEIGAFLAGISLANLREEQQISSRVKPLRDLFIVFFFILLGLGLTFDNVISQVFPIILLSLFILIGNPLIILTIMGILGFRKRTSFMASVTVAQISEFSLILMALGLSVGHLDQKTVDMVTAIGLITIICSSYMIIHSRSLYKKLNPLLKYFQRKDTLEDFAVDEKKFSDHVILVGSGRLGFEILKQLQSQNFQTLVVDFNPAIISYLKEEKIDFLFGDITDPDIMEAASVSTSKIIISTVFDPTDTIELLNSLKGLSHKPIVMVTAAEREWAVKFYQNGADYVIVPRVLSGHQVAHLLSSQKLADIREGRLKTEHLEELRVTLEKLSL